MKNIFFVFSFLIAMVSTGSLSANQCLTDVYYGCGSCIADGVWGSRHQHKEDCSWSCDRVCGNEPAEYSSEGEVFDKSELQFVKMRSSGYPNSFLLINTAQTCMKVMLLWYSRVPDFTGGMKVEVEKTFETLQSQEMKTFQMGKSHQVETLSESKC